MEKLEIFDIKSKGTTSEGFAKEAIVFPISLSAGYKNKYKHVFFFEKLDPILGVRLSYYFSFPCMGY